MEKKATLEVSPALRQYEERLVIVDVTPRWWSQQKMELAGQALVLITKNAHVHDVWATRQKLRVSLSGLPDDVDMAGVERVTEKLRTLVEELDDD